MLFEAAAVITAALALAGVGGEMSAPAYSIVSVSTVSVSTVSVQQTAEARLSDRQADAGTAPLWSQLGVRSGASVEIDLTTLRSMTGTNLLAGMAQLPLADLATFAADFPTRIDTLLAAPPKPTAVTDWWSTLDAGQRATLTAATPRLVGSLDGVPLAQRSRANESLLRDGLAEAAHALAGELPAEERSRLGRQQAMLSQVDLAMHASVDGPKRSLILLDTSGTGRAAIALGNPDTADYISYLVPGMNYQVTPTIVDWTRTADDLYREQAAVLARSGPAAVIRAVSTEAAPAPTIATISWIGYEAPDVFSVAGRDRALVGSEFLEKSWSGVRSTRGADQPFLSVFAHSYGSTVSLMALANGSVQVDALVLVGSPGSEIQAADKLNVADGNVFVGKADWDVAVNTAFFGSDPGASSYGARVLGVHGGTDRVTGSALAAVVGHNSYFQPGSESLHNMALIGTDNAELVTGDTE